VEQKFGYDDTEHFPKEKNRAYCFKIPSYAKRKIDEVAVDLNQGYKDAIKKALPQVRVLP